MRALATRLAAPLAALLILTACDRGAEPSGEAAPAAPEIEGVERVGSAVEDDPVVLAEGGRGRSLIHVFAGPRSFATLDRVAERNNRVMRSSAPYCGRGAP